MMYATTASITNTVLASPTHDEFVEADDLRTIFALSMSAMYRSEVPLYGDLVQIVQSVNQQVLSVNPTSSSNDSAQRLSLERHGAIRLGTAQELQTVRRIFALLGMSPVDYYDLSVAGLPMHATAFRPISISSLNRNPFRVFTTLLRLELLTTDSSRDLTLTLLQRRRIFPPELLQWIDTADSQHGRLTSAQAEQFIPLALLPFSWRGVAASTKAEYTQLYSEHSILADIACFQSAHINHLTPRTLDIQAAHAAMKDAGMSVKSSIEGPPKRLNPILLRQTSFLALQEQVNFLTSFADRDAPLANGRHKARFGEIEERGAAVTPKGRRLYDHLHGKAVSAQKAAESANDGLEAFSTIFSEYPDDWETLRSQRLVYCEYRCTATNIEDAARSVVGKGSKLDAVSLDRLIGAGTISCLPITYEDFLPFSAAGIFRSNLHSGSTVKAEEAPKARGPDRQGLERSLGCQVLSSDDLYKAVETQSLKQCAEKLGLVLDIRSDSLE